MSKAKDHKVIDMLAKVAADVAPVRSARIAAAVYIGREMIALGTNQAKTHTFQQKFQKHEKACYWHAETNAIYNALKRVNIHDLENATLYVARVKYDNSDKKIGKLVFGSAKPCIGCESCIQWTGIKRVCYTTDAGTLEDM